MLTVAIFSSLSPYRSGSTVTDASADLGVLVRAVVVRIVVRNLAEFVIAFRRVDALGMDMDGCVSASLCFMLA